MKFNLEIIDFIFPLGCIYTTYIKDKLPEIGEWRFIGKDGFLFFYERIK